MKNKIILLTIPFLLAGCGGGNSVEPTPTPEPEKYHSDYGPTEETYFYITGNFERNWTVEYSDDFKTITKNYHGDEYQDVYYLNDYYQLDEVRYFEANDSGVLEINCRDIYEYNEFGDLKDYSTYWLKDGEFILWDQDIFEYDEENRLVKHTYSSVDYSTNVFYLFDESVFEYNDNEVIETYTAYNVDGTLRSCIKTKTVTTIDEVNGTYTETISKTGDGSDEFVIDDVSTYDAKTNLLLKDVYYDDGTVYGTTTITYNENGDILTQTTVQGDDLFTDIYEYNKYGYIVSHEFKFTYPETGIEWRQFTTYVVDTNGVVFSAYLEQTRGGSYENSYYYDVSAIKANYKLPLEELDLIAACPGNYCIDMF